jgi:DNA-directed RNA polymerase specialized sigma24 family protein
MAAPAFSIPHQNAARLSDPALREALLKYARRRLPPGEVEDLVQNTLTEALISGSPPSDEGDFRRWVHGIARHKIADSYRRRGRLPVLGADVDVDAKAAPLAAAPGELVQWIERELPKTDGAHATLHWLLRESDGESLDEIARDVALPAPRVRQRVSRLRRHFHARWLALGAAGLILLLAAGLLLHGTRAPSTPSIARESATPHDSAPRTVEPTPPQPSAPAAAPPIDKQLAPKQLAPKQLAPSKVRSNDVRSKAEPQKVLQPKAKPVQKAPSSKNAVPSKRDALDNDLTETKASEPFAGSKKKH